MPKPYSLPPTRYHKHRTHVWESFELDTLVSPEVLAQHRFEYAYRQYESWRTENGKPFRSFNARCSCGWYQKKNPLDKKGIWTTNRSQSIYYWSVHVKEMNQSYQERLFEVR